VAPSAFAAEPPSSSKCMSVAVVATVLPAGILSDLHRRRRRTPGYYPASRRAPTGARVPRNRGGVDGWQGTEESRRTTGRAGIGERPGKDYVDGRMPRRTWLKRMFALRGEATALTATDRSSSPPPPRQYPSVRLHTATNSRDQLAPSANTLRLEKKTNSGDKYRK